MKIQQQKDNKMIKTIEIRREAVDAIASTLALDYTYDMDNIKEEHLPSLAATLLLGKALLGDSSLVSAIFKKAESERCLMFEITDQSEEGDTDLLRLFDILDSSTMQGMRDVVTKYTVKPTDKESELFSELCSDFVYELEDMADSHTHASVEKAAIDFVANRELALPE